MKWILLFLFSIQFSFAQTFRYRACVVAFYNLENFYDTVNNPLVNDDDFTAAGSKKYNTSIFLDKLEKLATVIHQLGSGVVPAGPALLGVAEIENDTVLEALIHHPFLRPRNYQYIHFDSKDPRGIDVALLYNPSFFTPEKAIPLFVPLPGKSKEAFFTRDILYVTGWLAGERIHVYVNHWPSRRGGEERSNPAREAAAATCRKHLDSILQQQPDAKIIVMGDLNDDPDSPSITEALKAEGNVHTHKTGTLYNPWNNMYKEGIGTLANRDTWGLFDQIIITRSWLIPSPTGFWFHEARIFNPGYLKENNGRYKNYPMRTWDGNTYRGGYSDHFPTYIVLLKNLK